MKTFISLCFLLLVTLSNSQYGPVNWALCPGAPKTWIPFTVQIKQDPNLKQVLTFSAFGIINSVGHNLDFQTLLVNESIGANYTWNSTSPYVHQNVGSGYFALNHTTYLPSLNETSVGLTMSALDPNGNELACIAIVLKNTTKISI